MSQECSTKTITEVVGTSVAIECFSDLNSDGTKTPSLFRADLLDEEKEINSVSGKEGELIITHEDSNETVAEVNDEGELAISLTDDDANKYENDNGELIYNE